MLSILLQSEQNQWVSSSGLLIFNHSYHIIISTAGALINYLMDSVYSLFGKRENEINLMLNLFIDASLFYNSSDVWPT